jgi:hypothetical protein
MKGTMLFTALMLTLPSLAMAHVSVQPRESRPGAEEQYTVRVPTGALCDNAICPGDTARGDRTRSAVRGRLDHLLEAGT